MYVLALCYLHLPNIFNVGRFRDRVAMAIKNVTVRIYHKLSKDQNGHNVLDKSCQKEPKIE